MRPLRYRWQGIGLAVVVVFIVFVSPAAESGAAELGIYFDTGGNVEGLDVAPFSIFTFYAVASGVGSGVIGYEFELEHSDAITILNSTIHPAGALDLYNSNTEFLVGTNLCHGGGSDVVLVTFTAMLMREGTNFVIRASGLRDGSIDDETPAYVPCDDRQTVYGFEETPAAFVNPKTDSFGRMKERYGS